jgi:WD40 repeat protein
MRDWDEFELLQKYLDGVLPANEGAALEVRLKSEPALAAEIVRMSRDEAICRDWAVANAATTPSESNTIQPTKPVTRRRFSLAWIVAASVVTLFALFVAQLDRASRSVSAPRALAFLEDIHGIVEVFSPNGQVRAAEPGQPLFAGQEVRTGEEGSSTVLRWQDETKLQLAAETHVKLPTEIANTNAKNRQPQVFVSEGVVSADVATDRSLIILSDHAELRNARGRISFVSLQDETFVETDSGFARLMRKSDGTMIDVHPGYFAVANKDRAPFRPNKAPQRQNKPRHSMMENTGPVTGLMFDPEGASLTGAAGDAVKRWDLSSGKLVWTLRPQKKKQIRNFTSSQDGKMLAVAVDERAVRVFDAATGEDLVTYRSNKRVTATALSSDSRILAVAWHAPRETTEIHLYDTTLGIERLLVTGQNSPIQSLAFGSSGDMLVTANADRTVKIWDVRVLTMVRALPKHSHDIRSLAISPDERFIAIGDRVGHIRIVETATGSERALLTGHLRDVVSMSFSPDGLRLASGSLDGTARIWHVSDRRELAAFKGHKNAVNAVAFSQDGRTLATGGADRAVMLWDVLTRERK